MNRYKYLIVGGGMAGDAAVQGIREADPNGSVGVIGAEPHRPYNRPPLSKGLWKDKPPKTIDRQAAANGADLKLGVRIERLDPAGKRVTGADGASFEYEKLLLATGGSPRRLPFGDDAIIYFRTRDDYDRLRAMSDRGGRFAVIGGGFIGSEIAAALKANGSEVVMVFPGRGIGDRIFPVDLSQFLNGYFREKGVEVLSGVEAIGLEPGTGRRALIVRDVGTSEVRRLEVDGIVAGIGIEPEVGLAKSASLDVEDGIRVNASLQTSDPDIYAAGDVARFHNPALGDWLRVEHEDNANTMGRLAGLSMAGQAVRYDHLPFFYSDLFELGYEAVGITDSRLETIVDWKEPYREGVVYYMREGRVRGALLWNVWEQVEAARRLIAEPGPFAPEALRGRAPSEVLAESTG